MIRSVARVNASVMSWLALLSSLLADAPLVFADVHESSTVHASPPRHERESSPAESAEPRARVPAPNALFLELLGPAMAYSVNYERVLFSQLAARVGFAPLWASNELRIAAPITLAYVGIYGLEVGGGVTFLSFQEPIANVLVGYRIHPSDGAGFQFRTGGLILVGKDITHAGDVFPWLYLSVGVGF